MPDTFPRLAGEYVSSAQHNDQPLTRITPNSSEDPLKSRPAYTTRVVAPGEINDRYRNAIPENGIGYPIFAPEWLHITSESLRLSVVIGAYRFPGNARITALEAAAKAESLHAPIDTVYFGRWRD
jgi:hypothetical protein